MKSKHEILFDKPQYTRLIIGVLLVAIGFVFMSGGGSDDPKVFHEDVFNFQRIGLAPAVILIGFGVVIYSIFKK